MPTIAFDILIPANDEQGADNVQDAFQQALDVLVKKDRLSSATLQREDNPDVPEEVVQELREVYIRDRDGVELGATNMLRLLIDAEGENVSYNSLAMGLSRILNPKVELPTDRMQLEPQEESFEVAPVYPWTVEIRR